MSLAQKVWRVRGLLRKRVAFDGVGLKSNMSFRDFPYYGKINTVPRENKYCPISICDIGQNTWTMTMAKYLPILSRGDTER